ncbi:MAG TPA: hypothetical protein DIT99_01430, partial [Candidatus Latescibacteria bacterium]|nr:hypothetical protein [Candidatus Latescibacterota bacterium]
NSTLPCLAVEAVRRFMQRPPFGYLHRLQQCLFVQGRNINDRLLLGQVALEFGLRRSEFDASLEDQELRDIVSAQFVSSRVYGTNALPSVLVENSAERRLLLGGYADAAMLVAQIRARLALSA